MTHTLVHPTGTTRPQSLENRPARAARTRRAAVTVLSAVARYDAIVIAAATTVLAFHSIINHDGPLANLTTTQAAIAALALIGAASLIDAVATDLIDWINPDRWDGDTAYALAEELGNIHDDIDSGADPEEIHHSLRTSGLLMATGVLSRRLGLAFAERGEDDQAQRLYAAVIHLRKADEVLGHREAGETPDDGTRKDLQ
ncbi:hypothetical protein [Streptomyces antarcticus]|uniref:hypothetical protein n=1 Tax=Streptomyces antarcticus TaxID=2996458 RepID=UPI00226FD499|nr:hypothetical protein [Streptomyces sp. H34-AA3]MCY0946302.1 hypothetical protein [Streptomyces sp. H34-AA3]